LQRQHHYNDSSPPPLISIRQSKPIAYVCTYLNSPTTIEQYPKRLQIFFEFLGLEGDDIEQQGQAFLEQVKQNPQRAQDNIMMYMDSLKKRVKQNTTNERKSDAISAGTVRNYIQAIKSFYEAHDLPPTINWRRISKARRVSNDRAPTIEEVRKAIQANDRRVKPIILVMCSSGIRVGAWDYLRWKHVIPLKNDKGDIIATKLIVYNEEHDEYY
jgi:hypothetical protein